MAIRVAINGFGRIGRTSAKIILNKKDIELVAINDLTDTKTLAHLFKYDTLMGIFPGTVVAKKNALIINGVSIAVISESDPSDIKWRSYKIDWVVESSGYFTKRKEANKHIDAGAKHVLITAPAEGDDVSIIPGVNMSSFNPKNKIVSLGSCTTNAFIPMLAVLDKAFGIKAGFMTTIHAYTNTQVLLDVEHKDLRRSRAAALNIIPTSTGASEMIEKILPELAGKLTSTSIRVPVAKVSIIDLSVEVERPISAAKINAAFKKAGQTSMKGIMDLTMEPLVSSDFSGNSYSVVIDGLLTAAQGRLGKAFGWYDNEWGYSERLKDFLLYVSDK